MGRGVGGEGGDGLDTYWYYVDWDLDFMTIVTIMMNYFPFQSGIFLGAS